MTRAERRHRTIKKHKKRLQTHPAAETYKPALETPKFCSSCCCAQQEKKRIDPKIDEDWG